MTMKIILFFFLKNFAIREKFFFLELLLTGHFLPVINIYSSVISLFEKKKKEDFHGFRL